MFHIKAYSLLYWQLQSNDFSVLYLRRMILMEKLGTPKVVKVFAYWKCPYRCTMQLHAVHGIIRLIWTNGGSKSVIPRKVVPFGGLNDENRRLCSTFAHYFVDKIVKLRDSVSDTLCALSVSVPSDLSFPSHRGSVLDILSPVTSDEVGRVLASSPAKSSTMDIIPTSLVLRCKAVFL